MVQNRPIRRKGTAMKNYEIDFDSADYTNEERAARDNIVGLAKRLERYLMVNLPASRESSLALTRLEESVMWACKAVYINGVIGE